MRCLSGSTLCHTQQFGNKMDLLKVKSKWVWIFRVKTVSQIYPKISMLKMKFWVKGCSIETLWTCPCLYFMVLRFCSVCLSGLPDSIEQSAVCLTADPGVVSSNRPQLSWRPLMHWYLWSFFPFLSFKKGNYQALAKVCAQVQSNLDSSNTDGSFTMANSNSFLSPYEILLIVQENKYLRKFSYLSWNCMLRVLRIASSRRF